MKTQTGITILVIFVLLLGSAAYAQMQIPAGFVLSPAGLAVPSNALTAIATTATAPVAAATSASTVVGTGTAGGAVASGGIAAFLISNPIGWAIDAIVVTGAALGGYALFDAYSDAPPLLLQDLRTWTDAGQVIEYRDDIQFDCDDSTHPEAGMIRLWSTDPIPWLGGYQILNLRCSDFDKETGFLGFGGGKWIEMEATGPLIDACKSPQAIRKVLLQHDSSTGSRTIDIHGCVKAEFGPTNPETWVSGDQEASLESGNGSPAVRITIYPQVAQNLKNSILAGLNAATSVPVDPAAPTPAISATQLTKGNVYIHLGDQDYEVAKTSVNATGGEGEVYKELSTIVRIKNANGTYMNTLTQLTKGNDGKYYLRLNGIEPGQYTFEFNFPKEGTKNMNITIRKEDLNLR